MPEPSPAGRASGAWAPHAISRAFRFARHVALAVDGNANLASSANIAGRSNRSFMNKICGVYGKAFNPNGSDSLGACVNVDDFSDAY
jgi:hypothetical protein